MPRQILFPIILMMCVMGAYTISHGIMFDVWTFLVFGVFGWLTIKFGLEIAPFIIGCIFGPAAEVHTVKSVESFGDLSIFLAKSWNALMLGILIIASIAGSVLLSRRHARDNADGPNETGSPVWP